MAPGFGGDLVASGLSPATQVSNPKTGDYQTAGAADPKPTRGVRVASIAVDGVSGELYATWHDGRFSGGLRDGIVFSRSLDGGLPWSARAQVKQAPSLAAITASLAVVADRTIGITCYDFRRDTADPRGRC